MAKFEMSIDREIQFMIKYQLTADELFVLRLIFYAQEGHDEYISMFFRDCQLGHSLKSILQSLQAKGIINESYVVPEEGSVFNAADVDLNESALYQFLQHSTDMGMELFEAYPAYTNISGRTFSYFEHIAALFNLCRGCECEHQGDGCGEYAVHLSRSILVTL